MDDGTQDDDAQVSEVASMDPELADVPISDDQAVAGNPDDQSGAAQEGTAGPDAPPRHGRPEDSNESSR